jgi:hypothetical protein
MALIHGGPFAWWALEMAFKWLSRLMFEWEVVDPVGLNALCYCALDLLALTQYQIAVIK